MLHFSHDFHQSIDQDQQDFARKEFSMLGITSIAIQALKKELECLNQYPSQNFSYQPCSKDNLTEWTAAIIGPRESPYAGGIFYVSIQIVRNYPTRVPRCTFLTPIYHINIIDGKLSPKFIWNWKPNDTLYSLLQRIASLLSNPSLIFCTDTRLKKQYIENEHQYWKKAQQWTLKYAIPQ